MTFREVVKEAFYNMLAIKEEYRFNCGNYAFNRDAITLYIETLLLLLFPIIPHFSEVQWLETYLPFLSTEEASKKPRYISQARMPDYGPNSVDKLCLKKNAYLQKVGKLIRASSDKFSRKNKVATLQKLILVVSSGFKPWQTQVLTLLQKLNVVDQSEF